MKFNPCSPFNRKSCHPVPVRTVAPGTDNQGTALSESAGKLLFTHPPLLQAGSITIAEAIKQFPPKGGFVGLSLASLSRFCPHTASYAGLLAHKSVENQLKILLADISSISKFVVSDQKTEQYPVIGALHDCLACKRKQRRSNHRYRSNSDTSSFIENGPVCFSQSSHASTSGRRPQSGLSFIQSPCRSLARNARKACSSK